MNSSYLSRHAVALVATILTTFTGVGATEAERGSASPTPNIVYQADSHCGESWGYDNPPQSYARADVDGDGTQDHFYATSAGVERYRIQEGTVPETLIRSATIYDSQVGIYYACADLQLVDLDDDHDLDMVFASPRELVVLEQRRGNFVIVRRQVLALDVATRVQITIHGRDISVE